MIVMKQWNIMYNIITKEHNNITNAFRTDVVKHYYIIFILNITLAFSGITLWYYVCYNITIYNKLLW